MIINIIGVKKLLKDLVFCVSQSRINRPEKMGRKPGPRPEIKFYFYFFKTLEPVHLTSFNLFKPDFYFLF